MENTDTASSTVEDLNEIEMGLSILLHYSRLGNEIASQKVSEIKKAIVNS